MHTDFHLQMSSWQSPHQTYSQKWLHYRHAVLDMLMHLSLPACAATPSMLRRVNMSSLLGLIWPL